MSRNEDNKKEDLKIHLIQDRMILLENRKHSDCHGIQTSQNISEFLLGNYI